MRPAKYQVKLFSVELVMQEAIQRHPEQGLQLIEPSRSDATLAPKLSSGTPASSADGCYGACLELSGSINRLSSLVLRGGI